MTLSTSPRGLAAKADRAASESGEVKSGGLAMRGPGTGEGQGTRREYQTVRPLVPVTPCPRSERRIRHATGHRPGGVFFTSVAGCSTATARALMHTLAVWSNFGS